MHSWWSSIHLKNGPMMIISSVMIFISLHFFPHDDYCIRDDVFKSNVLKINTDQIIIMGKKMWWNNNHHGWNKNRHGKNDANDTLPLFDSVEYVFLNKVFFLGSSTADHSIQGFHLSDTTTYVSEFCQTMSIFIVGQIGWTMLRVFPFHSIKLIYNAIKMAPAYPFSLMSGSYRILSLYLSMAWMKLLRTSTIISFPKLSVI